MISKALIGAAIGGLAVAVWMQRPVVVGVQRVERRRTAASWGLTGLPFDVPRQQIVRLGLGGLYDPATGRRFELAQTGPMPMLHDLV